MLPVSCLLARVCSWEQEFQNMSARLREPGLRVKGVSETVYIKSVSQKVIKDFRTSKALRHPERRQTNKNYLTWLDSEQTYLCIRWSCTLHSYWHLLELIVLNPSWVVPDPKGMGWERRTGSGDLEWGQRGAWGVEWDMEYLWETTLPCVSTRPFVNSGTDSKYGACRDINKRFSRGKTLANHIIFDCSVSTEKGPWWHLYQR